MKTKTLKTVQKIFYSQRRAIYKVKNEIFHGVGAFVQDEGISEVLDLVENEIQEIKTPIYYTTNVI